MSVIFITGATKNTGLAIARRFALAGYDVAVSSRRLEEAENTARELSREYGIHAEGYELELVDCHAVRRVFDCIKRDFGRLDTFVGNAAHLGVGYALLNSREEDYYDVIDANVKGNFFCCQHAARMMMENGGGSIVLIGSIHSNACITDRCLYSVSKGALNSLVRSIAVELGPHGIRANCLVAGAIRSDRWDALTDDTIAARRRNWPLGVESLPEDIANAAFYLGTELSRTVTGTELTVDSGLSASLLGFNGGKRYD